MLEQLKVLMMEQLKVLMMEQLKCQYKDIPVWSVTVGRPEDLHPQRSRKLTLKDMRPPERSRKGISCLL